MGIWTFNDIRSRTRDWLAILLACLLVLVFPIVGFVLYLLIRPKDTLAEVYDRALEEEALLRELEHAQACFNCGSPIKEEWVYCPTCHTELQHACANCGNLTRTEWDICVICAAPQGGMGAGRMAQPSAARSNARPNITSDAGQPVSVPVNAAQPPNPGQPDDIFAPPKEARRSNPFSRQPRAGD